ncbi:phage terminase small subunit P27 family [Terriglobus roseus]|uniref:Phage terminase, small subunit, putative, P27 family n=1 Tax=Terriglobus roseus TaxID=392734 RepID=A0A1G7G5G2_9BACT|nr:phage terminase small subunit P27 family [Terriglobus roseus]SDE83396.1 phage terminase, small subunit, putative, P27 family [Terriglobus roseus]
MVGRKPKPAAMHELEGTRNRHKNKGREPQFSGVPTCPDHLDDIAKEEWERVAPELLAAGLLTEADGSALAAYCAAYSRWINAELQLQQNGMVFHSPKSGYPVQSPYIGIANTSLTLMRQFLTEFGMTPASRSRITVMESDTQDKDPFTAFMNEIGAIEPDDEQKNLQ